MSDFQTIPEVLTCTFDPDDGTVPCLKDPIGRILWGGVGCCHLKSQDFNHKVQRLADALNEQEPETYERFKDIVNHSPMGMFGTRELPREEYGMYPPRVLDDTFWKQIWAILTGERTLTLVQKDATGESL